MYYLVLPITLLALATSALSDAISDFSNLKRLVDTTSIQILDSVTIVNSTNVANGSYPIRNPISFGAQFDTASAIAKIENAIVVSTAAYESDQATFVNGKPRDVIDAGYLTYVDEISTLAQAVIARGRAWHSEYNQPVCTNLQSLASAVHSYGYGLTRRGIIAQDSTIRTITAGGALVNAESTWSSIGTLPGLQRRGRLAV